MAAHKIYEGCFACHVWGMHWGESYYSRLFTSRDDAQHYVDDLIAEHSMDVDFSEFDPMVVELEVYDSYSKEVRL